LRLRQQLNTKILFLGNGYRILQLVKSDLVIIVGIQGYGMAVAARQLPDVLETDAGYKTYFILPAAK